MVRFLLLALVVVGGGEALGDGFDEIEFELGGPGIKEGAELGELAFEFRLGIPAEGIADFGEVDGEALDGFREEFLDGGGVDGVSGVRMVFGKAGALESFFEVEGFLEFSADEPDAIPALDERVALAVRDDAGPKHDTLAGIEVAKMNAGGLVAAETGKQFVLHPAESGMEFPK